MNNRTVNTFFERLDEINIGSQYVQYIQNILLPVLTPEEKDYFSRWQNRTHKRIEEIEKISQEGLAAPEEAKNTEEETKLTYIFSEDEENILDRFGMININDRTQVKFFRNISYKCQDAILGEMINNRSFEFVNIFLSDLEKIHEEERDSINQRITELQAAISEMKEKGIDAKNDNPTLIIDGLDLYLLNTEEEKNSMRGYIKNIIDDQTHEINSGHLMDQILTGVLYAIDRYSEDKGEHNLYDPKKLIHCLVDEKIINDAGNETYTISNDASPTQFMNAIGRFMLDPSRGLSSSNTQTPIDNNQEPEITLQEDKRHEEKDDHQPPEITEKPQTNENHSVESPPMNETSWWEMMASAAARVQNLFSTSDDRFREAYAEHTEDNIITSPQAQSDSKSEEKIEPQPQPQPIDLMGEARFKQITSYQNNGFTIFQDLITEALRATVKNEGLTIDRGIINGDKNNDAFSASLSGLETRIAENRTQLYELFENRIPQENLVTQLAAAENMIDHFKCKITIHDRVKEIINNDVFWSDKTTFSTVLGLFGISSKPAGIEKMKNVLRGPLPSNLLETLRDIAKTQMGSDTDKLGFFDHIYNFIFRDEKTEKFYRVFLDIKPNATLEELKEISRTLNELSPPVQDQAQNDDQIRPSRSA